MLLEAWMTDPFACCEKCGVTPPATLYCDKPQVQETLASPLPSPLHTASMPLEAEVSSTLTITSLPSPLTTLLVLLDSEVSSTLTIIQTATAC